MTWQDRFRSFIAEWMREEENLDVKVVNSVEEITKRKGGVCVTCGYDTTVLVIDWTDYSENRQSSEFETSFSNLFGV